MVKPYIQNYSQHDNKSHEMRPQYYAIRLDKDGSYIEFRHARQDKHYEIWKNHLNKKLNQRGFHDKFKAINKLG